MLRDIDTQILKRIHLFHLTPELLFHYIQNFRFLHIKFHSIYIPQLTMVSKP